jgi:hypothetical protein
MKKINYFIIVAAVLMLIIPLLGCPTKFDGKEWDLMPVGDVVGELDGDGIVLPALALVGGDFLSSVVFTYDNSMSAWGGGNGTMNFKVRKVAGDWSGGDYGLADGVDAPVVGGDFVELGSGGNITVTGLQNGTKYRITVKSTASAVSLKIEAI